MSWFSRTYQQTIYQPQVLKILSNQYSYVNSLQETDSLSAKMHCAYKWPELKRDTIHLAAGYAPTGCIINRLTSQGQGKQLLVIALSLQGSTCVSSFEQLV